MTTATSQPPTDGPAGPDGARRTRAEALRAAVGGGAALAAAALAGGWTRPAATIGRPTPAQDARILNFLLVVEETQAGFYAAALRSGALRGDLLEYARVVAPQEREHVALLRRRLGRRAAAPPRLDFGDAITDAARFRTAAIDLEEQAAAAYIGQGASLSAGPMQEAARIVAVEARHAAWIRDLAGADPAPRAADPASPASDVLSHLREKGFLR
jgi:ferritin-like protein